MFVRCPYCECEDNWVGHEYGPGSDDGCSHPTEIDCQDCGNWFDVEYEGSLEGESYVMFAIGTKKGDEE